ncbi:myosin-binding protein H-like [Arachis ipaensis]|uniref:myosin-binding protein H-like n=1 Tax=Arachis ipaensis TaxID=130454 RepID=UPI0007AFAFA7|nr:myosin-binding protein H-like [Arachis ipaensis]
MAALADVPWSDDDVRPPPADADDREVTIPWGVWVHEKPPASRRSRARAVIGTPSPPAPAAGPSSSTAAAPPPSTDPPAAPEPTYLLVQRLFQFLERERHHVRRRLDRMDQALISLGAELPPLPDSPASDEQDHQEEDGEAPAQQDAPDTTEPAHMEAPPQTQETQPVLQPQLEPEPIVVPPTDPPV